eukprot:5154704-Pleurochrysis_carterae.AAC.2
MRSPVATGGSRLLDADSDVKDGDDVGGDDADVKILPEMTPAGRISGLARKNEQTDVRLRRANIHSQ